MKFFLTSGIFSAFVLMALAANGQQSTIDGSLKKTLIGVWKTDYRVRSNGSPYLQPGGGTVLKSKTGPIFNFRESFFTDDSSPSGEKLSYFIRPDSVIVIVNKYYFKILQVTKDSLIWQRSGLGTDDPAKVTVPGHIYHMYRAIH